MAFRLDEARINGNERARSYLVPRNFNIAERDRSEEALEEIIFRYGPVIDAYPTWHPLVSNYTNVGWEITTPSGKCGYKGLDHTVCLTNAFITCPYGDGEAVLEAVDEIRGHVFAEIRAEPLDVQFYHVDAAPILVCCEWQKPIPDDGTIPKELAVPLMLEREIPCWTWAEVAETWERMRPYFLGRPHGGRSSLFVNQETGQAMKNVWKAIINSGMYGPIKV